MHLTSADVRPNALILSYPVITAGEFAHRGSFRSLTGTDDIAAHQPHSLENLVTPDTPPTFLWHTWTDGAVPVENTLLMARRCTKRVFRRKYTSSRAADTGWRWAIR